MNTDPMTIAYLSAGAMSIIERNGEAFEPHRDKVGGELGLIGFICDHADAIDEQFVQLQRETGEAFHGVHAYDIAQQVGSWYVGQLISFGGVPTRKEVLDKSRRQYFANCSEEVLDTDNGNRVILRSSHANILVDRKTGVISEVRQLPGSEDSFKDVIAFDPRDLDKAMGDEMDILDAGYWDQTGNYSPARESMGPPGEPDMHEYLVAWEINIVADDEVQAAKVAMDALRSRVDNEVVFLAVTDENGDTNKINVREHSL